MDSFFARNRLSAYLDGALTDAEAAEVSEAIERDPELRAEFEALQAAVELLRREGPVEAPVGFHARVMERVRDEPAPGGVVVQLRRVFTRVPVEALALAAAAAVVLVVIGGKPDAPEDDAVTATRELALPSTSSASPEDSRQAAAAPEPAPAPAPLESVSTKGAPAEAPNAAPEVQKKAAPAPRSSYGVDTKAVQVPDQPLQTEWEKQPQVGDERLGNADGGDLATPHGYRLVLDDAQSLFTLANLAERYQGTIRDMAGRKLRPRALTPQDDYAQLLFVVPTENEAQVHGSLRSMGGVEVVPPSTTPLTTTENAVFVVEVRYQP